VSVKEAENLAPTGWPALPGEMNFLRTPSRPNHFRTTMADSSRPLPTHEPGCLPAIGRPSIPSRQTFLTLAISFFVPLFGSAHAATIRAIIAKMDRVRDGDTITAVAENKTLRNSDRSFDP